MTWETVPLSELVQSVDRSGPPKDSTSFTYVDLSSVDAVTKTITAPSDVRVADAPSRARQNLRFADVLVSTVRPNLNGVAAVPEALDGAVGSTGFSVLRSKPDRLEPRYLFHWTQSGRFVSSMTRLATGASYPAVSDAIVKRSRIPLPPLAEQRRIAAILDEADALRLTAICRLRLFQKLEESAFELVLAASTDSVPLGSVVRLITGPFGSSVHKEDYVTGGIPLVNPSHILAGEVAVDPRVAVSKGKADQLSAFFLREGDVVLGRRGEMGRAAVVRKADLPALCGTGTMILRSPDHSPIGSFLARVLRTPRFVSVLAAAASGVTMPNLSQSAVADIRIPRPSAAVESRVAAFDRDMASARQQVVVATQQLDSLFASLQHRAFRGEL